MSKYVKKTLVVMGLAIALPSTILGAFLFFDFLVKKNFISYEVSLVLLLIVIVYFLMMMVKYGMAKKNR